MDYFYATSFKSHVEDLMRQHHVPGLAIAIVQNDQVISAGYGNSSLEPLTPCTADTLFDIASSAKSLTAASIGLLVDDNENFPEVQYDAVVSKLLPDDFVMPRVEYTNGVTLDDILSHRTGMAAHDNSYLGPRAVQPDDAQSVTRNLRNLPVVAPLRTKYLYCNMMYTVATYLVEVKSQRSFADFLHERIFRPLGMQSTSLQPEAARVKGYGNRLATGYYWTKQNAAYTGLQIRSCPEGQGAGSIISSSNDFIIWIKALVNREHPINERVYQGLVRMRSFPNPNARRLKPYTSPVVYAAGLDIYYYRGHTVVGHNGVTSGFGSRFCFLPDLKFGVVILGNSTGAGSVATTLVRELIDDILKVQEPDQFYQIRNKVPHDTLKGGLTIKPKRGLQIQGKDRTKDQSNSRGERQGDNQGKQKVDGKGNKPQETHVENSQPQVAPLEAYVGRYQHPGYHGLTVQIKDGKLFIDATDRSMGFTLTFDHVRDQTVYTAHLSDLWEGGDDPVQAEFVFEDSRAVKLGLRLEFALKELIWFERVEES